MWKHYIAHLIVLLLGEEVAEVIFDLVLEHAELGVVLACLFVLEDECVHVVVYAVLVNIDDYDVVCVASRCELRYVLHYVVLRVYAVLRGEHIGEYVLELAKLRKHVLY